MKQFIIRTDLQRSAAAECIAQLPLSPLHEVIIREHRTRRNLEQNELAWKIVTAISEQVEVEGRRYDKDIWWVHLKSQFFGREMVEMPDGRLIEREPRSSTRDTGKFSEWIEFLYSVAAEHEVVIHEDSK